MDYTTVERVKQEIRSTKTSDDALLAKLITAASRAIDRKCTGVPDNEAIDYFKLETKTAEEIPGQINNKGVVLCAPRKPIVVSVSSFEYRTTPIQQWTSVPADRLQVDGTQVTAYPIYVVDYSCRAMVRLTYSGGLAATVEALPADLVEAATILAVRFYREAETGLSDVIGVADLGTMSYTKAWPVRVLEQIQPFKRVAGWRNIA